MGFNLEAKYLCLILGASVVFLELFVPNVPLLCETEDGRTY